jgi:hypothetical protein
VANDAYLGVKGHGRFVKRSLNQYIH